MYVCVLSHFSRVWLFVTPQTAALQAPLSMGSSRQDNCSRLPCPPQGDLPDPGIEPMSLTFLHWQAGSLPLVPPGKPQNYHTVQQFHSWVCIQKIPKMLIPKDAYTPVFTVALFTVAKYGSNLSVHHQMRG